MTQEHDDTEIVIFYEDREAFRCTCKSNGTDLKDTIRYWMGKSPGMYRDEIEKIVCYPRDCEKDVTHVLNEIDEERFEREQEYRERAQRTEYERLKKIYET